MDNCNMSVKEYWMSYNILKGVKNIDPVWEVVISTCMNKMWQKLWPDCVHVFRGFEEVHKIAIGVSAIAQELRLDSDVRDDVTVLLGKNSVSCKGGTGRFGCTFDSETTAHEPEEMFCGL
jgi:hypothetical protein